MAWGIGANDVANAMGTSVERSTVQTTFYKRGEAFGLPGCKVDGMDVLAVRKTISEAVEHVRNKKSPYIVEAMTYRYRGHSMSDPAKYRTRDEVTKMRKDRDPINGLGELLISNNATDQETLKEIDKKIKKIIQKAAEYAQESPEPNSEELFSDVYIEENTVL